MVMLVKCTNTPVREVVIHKRLARLGVHDLGGVQACPDVLARHYVVLGRYSHQEWSDICQFHMQGST